MPRSNSSNWSVNDDISAVRLQDFNDDIDAILQYGSDRLRVYTAVSGTALKVDIGAGSWRIGSGEGTYAGATDVSVTNTATNYIMIDAAGSIVINTTGWVVGNGRLATVVCSGGVITSITQNKADLTSGTLGGAPSVLPKTADYTIVTGDSPAVLSNDGATAAIVLTLPAASADGYDFFFHSMEAKGMKIQCVGDDSIKYISQSVTDVASDAPYACLHIRSLSATEWVVESILGTWNWIQVGFILGGNTGSDSSVIDKMTFTTPATPTCAVHAATLDTARARLGGCSGFYNGYTGGGDIGGTDSAIISKMVFSAETEATLAATLDNAREQNTHGLENANIRGYWLGGGVTTSSDKIDYVSFADDTSVNLGISLAASRQGAATVDRDTTAGYYMGGNATSIYKMTYNGSAGAEAMSTLAAVLPASKLSQLPVWSATKGYACGGNGGPIATCQALTYAAETVAQLGNNLPAAREDGMSISNVLNGFCTGGGTAIYSLLFSAETWTTLSAVLSTSRSYGASISAPAR